MAKPLKAPFPYFGGKRAVASLVWRRLGNVDNYIEPFAGSLAVLLSRPHAPRVETVNDYDAMISNFWRATQHDPEAVAAHADGPVSEPDLHARHRWLVLSDDAAAFRAKMRTDPHFYDTKIAGWWCWGICQWIGGGWCAHADGPGRRPVIAQCESQHGNGVHGAPRLPVERHQNAPPDLAFSDGLGMGVHRVGPAEQGEHGQGELHQRRPIIAGDNAGSYGKGVHAKGEQPALWQQFPDLTSRGPTGGQGVHAQGEQPALWEQIPDLASGGGTGLGRGVHGVGPADKLPRLTGGYHYGGLGVHADEASLSEKLPRLTGQFEFAGLGVHMDSGRGNGPSDCRPEALDEQALSQQLPFIGGGTWQYGMGVHAGRPQLADAYSLGRGVHAGDAAGTCAQRRAWLLEWFGRLRDRLRCVRVCCGDWARVCTSDSVTTRLGLCGVVLDPPYPRHHGQGKKSRDGGLYASDAAGHKSPEQIRDEVLAWCRERGPDPRLRIAVCGYQGDGYEDLEKAGWEVVEWKAAGGYGNRTERGKANARRERLWFSPACQAARTLFDDLPAQPVESEP